MKLRGLRAADKRTFVTLSSAMRVVSLLPSATELICAVPGGERLLVGRSHECDFPDSVAHLPVLTGQRTQATDSAAIDQQVRESLSSGGSLYTLDGEQLADLAPDVILTQDLCDVCSIDLDTVRQIAGALHPTPRIVSLNPMTLEDVFDDLVTVGEVVGLNNEARQAMIRLRDRYETTRDHVNPYLDGVETAFFEWMDPLFAGGHWTPQLIERAGGRHSLNPPGAKSKQVNADVLVASQPQRLIICPCGYDLEQIKSELPVMMAQSWWHDLPAVQNGDVAMVDGNQMFNRPGPRLVDAFCWLVGWINDLPQLIPPGFPVEPLPHSRPAHR